MPAEPTHIIDAERSVLGGTLLDTAPIATVELEAGDFSSPRNRVIWTAITALIAAGEPVDIVTVADALGDKLAMAGGKTYLAELSGCVSTAANVGHWSRDVAARAHQGQTDKAGAPYIDHVMRVEHAVHGYAAALQCVAILHDVAEDTSMTPEALGALFPPIVVAALDAITRRDGETYVDYIERVADNALARIVKIEDLRDHLDAVRVGAITAGHIKRYRAALKRLGAEDAK